MIHLEEYNQNLTKEDLKKLAIGPAKALRSYTNIHQSLSTKIIRILGFLFIEKDYYDTIIDKQLTPVCMDLATTGFTVNYHERESDYSKATASIRNLKPTARTTGEL